VKHLQTVLVRTLAEKSTSFLGSKNSSIFWSFRPKSINFLKNRNPQNIQLFFMVLVLGSTRALFG